MPAAEKRNLEELGQGMRQTATISIFPGGSAHGFTANESLE